MQLSAILKKTSDGIDGLVFKAVIALIIAMIITITLQILSRTLAQAFTWTEELSRYLLVWSSFLAATLAYKRGLHIAVTIAADALPAGLRSVVSVINTLLTVLFFGLVIWNGYSLMALQIFQVSPALQLPMRWIYLVIPLASAIMLIHSLATLTGEARS